jgi:hypothetical protein
MSDVPSTTVPLEFAKLTRNQKRFVRKLAWETLKEEAQFIVIIPSVIGCLGAIFGIVAGVALGRLVFSQHAFRCFVICVVIGTGAGVWIGRTWLERECRQHFKHIIRDHEGEISRIA